MSPSTPSIIHVGLLWVCASSLWLLKCSFFMSVRRGAKERRSLRDLTSWCQIPGSCSVLHATHSLSDAAVAMDDGGERVSRLAEAWQARHVAVRSAAQPPGAREVERHVPLSLCRALGACFCRGQNRRFGQFYRRFMSFLRSRLQGRGGGDGVLSRKAIQ